MCGSASCQSIAGFSPLRYATGLARQVGDIYRGDGECSRTQRDAAMAFWRSLGAAAATSVALVTAALMNTVVARRRLELEISIWTSLRGR